MEKLLSVTDVAARYKCSLPTARKRMRDMNHMEKPLMVTESAILIWERNKTIVPTDKTKVTKKKKHSSSLWVPGVSKVSTERSNWS